MNKRILIYLFVALAAIAAITGVVMLSNPFVEDSPKATTPGVVEPTQEPAATQKPSSQTTAKPAETEPPEPLSVAFDSMIDPFEWKMVDDGGGEHLLFYAEFELEQFKEYQVIMELDEFHLPLDLEGSPQIRYDVDFEVVCYDQSPDKFDVDDRADGVATYSFEVCPVETGVVRLYFATASLRFEDSFPDIFDELASFIIYYK